MARLNKQFDFWDSFRRLERIVSQASAPDRIERLFQRHQAKRARVGTVTWEEHLEFGLAVYDAGRMPADAAMFWVRRALIDVGPGEDQIQSLYGSEFHDRFEAIRKKHGLTDEEDWAPGEGPAENQALNAEFEAAERRIHGEVLREYASTIGHPLIQEAADLYKTDRLAFERRVEKGRQWFFGPPDEALAKYLRSQGIID
jgi:hypothetical protein